MSGPNPDDRPKVLTRQFWREWGVSLLVNATLLLLLATATGIDPRRYVLAAVTGLLLGIVVATLSLALTAWRKPGYRQRDALFASGIWGVRIVAYAWFGLSARDIAILSAASFLIAICWTLIGPDQDREPSGQPDESAGVL